MTYFGAVLSQKRTFLVILQINTILDLGMKHETCYNYGFKDCLYK